MKQNIQSADLQNTADESPLIEMGNVLKISGEILIKSADGVLRALELNDSVFLGDSLVTVTGEKIDLYLMDTVQFLPLSLNEDESNLVSLAAINQQLEQQPTLNLNFLQQHFLTNGDSEFVTDSDLPIVENDGGFTVANNFVAIQLTGLQGIIDSGFDTTALTLNSIDTRDEDDLFFIESDRTITPETEKQTTVATTTVIEEPNITTEAIEETNVVLPMLMVTTDNINEGQSAVFTFTLDSVSESDVVIQFTTQDGTAISAQQDYDALSGTVTIPAGETQAVVEVNTHLDHSFDNNETFDLVITQVENASLADNADATTITMTDQSTVIIGSNDDDGVYAPGLGPLEGSQFNDLIIGDPGATDADLLNGAVFNVAYVIDTSWSMAGSVDETYATRLDILQQAITELNTTYNELVDQGAIVNVQIIAFGSGSQLQGPTIQLGGSFNMPPVEELNQLIEDLSYLGTTDYYDALNETADVMAGFDTDADNATNTVYFISDGEPTQNVDAFEKGIENGSWDELLNNPDITVRAVGIGDDISTENLDAIDNSSEGPILVPDLSDVDNLTDVLEGIALESLEIQVGDDDIKGDDGHDIIFGDVPDSTELLEQLSAADQSSETYPQTVADYIVESDALKQYNDQAVGGDDTVFGGAGDDIIFGQGGNDVISGDAGDDIIYGGAGSDILLGNAGNDVFFGGEGDDYYALTINEDDSNIIYYETNDINGDDVVIGFNALTESNDQIDLSGLLDHLGVAEADRVDAVNLTEVSSNQVKLTVDNAEDFSIMFVNPQGGLSDFSIGDENSDIIVY